MIERQCAGCRKKKDRSELIKITNASGKAVINPDSLTFGRSAYLCYNKSCIELAFRKNKLAKLLKTFLPERLKGQLLDELRNGQNK